MFVVAVVVGLGLVDLDFLGGGGGGTVFFAVLEVVVVGAVAVVVAAVEVTPVVEGAVGLVIENTSPNPA